MSKKSIFSSITFSKTFIYCLICSLWLGSWSSSVIGQSMEKLSEAIEPQVVTLRELPFLQEVEKTFQSPDELRRVLRNEIDRTYPGDTLRVLEKRLLKFGFVVSPIDLDKLIMQLLSQQIAGYYDPRKKKMVLIESTADSGGQRTLLPLEFFSELLVQSIGLSLDKILLSHELTHVLQDQHFNLMSLPFEDIDQEDLTTAVRSLIEGDATLVMIDYMLRQQQQGLDATQVPDISASMHSWANNPLFRGFGMFQTVPRYIIDNLLFTYLYGFDFVLQIKKRGGWDGVNRAYKDFPVSTEQILHPEKYLEERDNPTTITLPGFSENFSQWQELERNTLGEFNIRILIDGFLSAEDARIAAEGWDGDRFVFYEEPESDQTLVIWYTTWDTEQDAREFFQRYLRVFEKRYLTLSPPASQSEKPTPSPTIPHDQTTWEIETHKVFMEIRGNDVLILDGIPKSLRQEALQIFWRSAKEPLS